jgi:hypothetical protein
MKPVYEIERRPTNRWLILAVWAFGIFIVLSFTGMVVAQIVIKAQPAPVAAPGEIRLESGIAAQVVAVPVAKWEYKTAATTTEEMKAAGLEGWELVSVAVLPAAGGGGDSQAYFKRPLRAAEKPALPAGGATGAGTPRRGERE